jgi:AraC-like DNA-binding protein
MPLQPRVTDVERLSFCSDVAAIGAFRCPAGHPLFRDSGPASGYLMVFPRTSTVIVHKGGPVTAAAPSAMFYNAGDVYSRKKIDAIDASDWYMVAPDVVRDVVERHDVAATDRPRALFSFVTGPVRAPIYLEQRELYTRVDSGDPPDALAVEERVITLLDAVVRDACQLYRRRAGERKSRVAGPVESTKAAVAANLGSNVSLRALAATAGCSPYQLCRAFRKTTGYTISGYRHALRIRSALDALCHTRTDITAIALDVGYSSHSHFTMVFRREFGITPSALRQDRTFARCLTGAVPPRRLRTSP